MIVEINTKDLYLRKPPFSFSAIKKGDIAFFSNGKAAVITRKIKPDNRGQSWYGLEFNGCGGGWVYDKNGYFDASGECGNASGMNISHIMKTK